jgi:hypothetical protein
VRELIAVNVLLEPDAATKVLAAELNAELRLGMAAVAGAYSGSGAGGLVSGFSFDATHLPHLTLVQRYVRRDALERVLEVVGKAAGRVIAGAEGQDLVLRAGDLSGGSLGTEPGTVLASVEFGPQPAVRALHEEVLRALTPFASSGGSEAAFFTLPGEPPPNAATVAYVEEFVPAHAGDEYTPHLTAGVAREADVRRLAHDHPLSGAEVTPVAVAVAHLGAFGTARQVLRRLPLL